MFLSEECSPVRQSPSYKSLLGKFLFVGRGCAVRRRYGEFCVPREHCMQLAGARAAQTEAVRQNKSRLRCYVLKWYMMNLGYGFLKWLIIITPGLVFVGIPSFVNARIDVLNELKITLSFITLYFEGSVFFLTEPKAQFNNFQDACPSCVIPFHFSVQITTLSILTPSSQTGTRTQADESIWFKHP